MFSTNKKVNVLKKYNITIVLLLALLLLVSISCTKELTAEEIRDKLIDANSNLHYYSLDLKMDLGMSGDLGYGNQRLSLDINMNGYVDADDKKGHLKGTVSVFGMTLPMETYIDNNVIYTSSQGAWQKSVSDVSWDQNDQMQQYLDLIKSGSLELLESKDDGYYSLKLKADNKKVIELMKKQMPSSGSQMDLEKGSVKKYDVTFKVNKKTFVVEHSTTDVEMNVGDGASTVEYDMHIEMGVSDVGKKQQVVIPEEAINAPLASNVQPEPV